MLCAIGLSLGAVGGIAAAQALRNVLYEAQAVDPAVLAATLLVLLAIGIVAPMPAAWRASRIDPCRV